MDLGLGSYNALEQSFHFDFEVICSKMIGDRFCDDLCNHPGQATFIFLFSFNYLVVSFQSFHGGDCCLEYIAV